MQEIVKSECSHYDCVFTVQAGYWGMSDDLQGCKPCDCDVGGAVNDRCDQQTGQCTCRPNIVGRRCDEVARRHFVVSLDWERYEAEKARGIGVHVTCHSSNCRD